MDFDIFDSANTPTLTNKGKGNSKEAHIEFGTQLFKPRRAVAMTKSYDFGASK